MKVITFRLCLPSPGARFDVEALHHSALLSFLLLEPQGLKPESFQAHNGASEAAPFQGRIKQDQLKQDQLDQDQS